MDNDLERHWAAKASHAPYKLTELKRILNDWQTTFWRVTLWGSLYWNKPRPAALSRFGNDSMSSVPCPSSYDHRTSWYLVHFTRVKKAVGMTNVKFDSMEDTAMVRSIRFTREAHIDHKRSPRRGDAGAPLRAATTLAPRSSVGCIR